MKNHNIVKPYLNNYDYEVRTGIPKHERYKENRHHILMKSRGGTDHEDNIVKLFLDPHEAFHRFNGNLTFPERLQRTLKMEGSALTNHVQEIIQTKLLTKQEDIEFWYKNHVIDKRYW